MKEDIRVIVFDIFGVIVDKEGNLREGILDILERLKEKKFKLLLCSNSSRRMIEIWDGKYDFLKYFDDIILSEDVKVNKPDPEMFKEIIDRNDDVLPQNILFIDDKDENVLASEAEGLIGMKYTRQGLQDLYCKISN